MRADEEGLAALKISFRLRDGVSEESLSSKLDCNLIVSKALVGF
jgi:hypothetical protein